MKRLLWGSIVSGLIVFSWGVVSWMALPWHEPLFNQFQNEAEVQGVLKASAFKKGVYLLPHLRKTSATGLSTGASLEPAGSGEPKSADAPFAFVVFQPDGVGPMSLLLARSILIQILAAFFVTLLLLQSEISTYLGRVGFTVIFGLSCGIISYLPEWNWWGLPLNYVLISTMDLVISWFLASLVLAKIVEPPRESAQDGSSSLSTTH